MLMVDDDAVLSWRQAIVLLDDLIRVECRLHCEYGERETFAVMAWKLTHSLTHRRDTRNHQRNADSDGDHLLRTGAASVACTGRHVQLLAALVRRTRR